jgi:hypothetical protein
MPNSDVTFTAVWELCEAKYETATNVWAYGTFTQALTGVMTGGRICLQKNVTASDDITIGKSITLMTDGEVSSAALTMGAYNLQVLDGTLTINDTDLIITGSDSTYGTVIIRSGSASTAKIILQAGNVYNTGNTAGAKAAIYTDIAGSTVSIAGGCVQSTNGSGISISNGILSVTGGTISSVVGDGILIEGTGSVSIIDGTIRSTAAYAVKVSGGSLTMNGGAITATADVGIYVNGGSITVNDGTIESDTDAGIYVTDGSVAVTGGTIDSDSDAGIYITDGDLSVTGGEIIGSTYAIHVNEASNSGNTLALAGAPELTGTTGDIYFANAYRALEITDMLTGAEIYTVAAAFYDAGASFSTTYAANYTNKFEALNSYWNIGYSSDEGSDNYQKLIWQKVVTITPDSAQSKVYTATDPTYTYKVYALGEEVTASSVGIKGALGRAAGENVTTYAYTLGTLAAPEGYYMVMSPSAPTFSIVKKGIAIPTITDKIYNGSSQGYGMSDETEYTYSVLGIDTPEATNAGNYTITATLTNTANYKWSDGSITAKSVAWKITPKAITVVPVSAARKVGEVNPDFTIELADGSTLTEADNLAYGADALAYAVGTPTLTCLDNEDSPVDANSAAGTYDINITSLTGGSSNYAVTYTGAASTGTLTITQNALGYSDYTITPEGYTVGNWTDSAITVSPAGSYQTIRSVAANGDRGSWVTSLTVQDESTSLTFECKVTTGSGTGAISAPKTLSLKSDTISPISTTPVETVNQATGVTTVTLTLSDDAAPGLLSGIDISSVTLTQGSIDCTALISASKAAGLSDNKLTITFTRANTDNYTLTYSDNAGNESKITIAMAADEYTVSYAAGSSEEGDIPTGTAPASVTGWQYRQITLPANPYTLPAHLFCGWEYKGKLYAAGGTFTMPGSDVELSAVWVPNQIADISGEVMYQNGKPVTHATINIYQDGQLIQQTDINGSGKFKFKKLKNDAYELEVVVPDQELGDQTQTYRIITRDGEIISGETGLPLAQLTVSQPQAVIDFSRDVNAILVDWDAQDLKQCWEGGDTAAIEALKAEIVAVNDDILVLSDVYGNQLSQVQIYQLFDTVKEKWGQLLAILGNITLNVENKSTLASVGDQDALVGLLITKEDLEAQILHQEDIQIIFRIEDVDQSDQNIEIQKSIALLTLHGGQNQKISKFFEVTIQKQIGNNPAISITETPKDVELVFWLPEDMRNGTDYRILRNHWDPVSGEYSITELPTRRIGDYLYASSDRFSTYAIGYVPNPEALSSGGDNGVSEDLVVLNEPVHIPSPKTSQRPPVTANAWMAAPVAIRGISRRRLRAPAPRRKKL